MADDKRWCGQCKNAKWCLYIHPYQGFYCPRPEEVINHKTHRKEPLASDLIGEGYDGFVNRSYLDVLNEMGETRAAEHKRRHDQIMGMPDEGHDNLIRKAIAALAFFGVSAVDTISILRIAKTTFYRLFPRSN
jgi:hypothetical protein